MKIREILEMASKITGKKDGIYLLSVGMNLDSARVLAHLDDKVDTDVERKLKEMLFRAKKGEPIQYIVNKADFFDIELYIERGVFIPREDTESVVQAVKESIKDGGALKIVDIGTGSGNIAITLSKEFGERARVIGVDISEKAISVAALNGRRYEVDVKFICADMFTAFSDDCVFDVIVSNPPYIPSTVIKTLPVSVKEFEPIEAVDGGKDGLDFYRRLFNEAVIRLKVGGIVAVEIDESIEEGVLDLARSFKECRVFKDFNGKDRAIVCWR